MLLVQGGDSNEYPQHKFFMEKYGKLSLNYHQILNIWAAAWQNQQNDLCAQLRLRSAWASAQFDQSLRCPHEETLDPQLPIEHKVKTLIRRADAQADLSLRWAHMSFCWFYRAAAHIRFSEMKVFPVGIKRNLFTVSASVNASRYRFINREK